ncbi:MULTISPECIES: hypothetical protein [Paenarthrobacter]|uniref:hypothetical protein n=1 Tax=Paenarthrobacter TaxID=1742992 RepID=UPI001877D79E|nr:MULTISPECIES: hypothetical protein [Paenarthrobacter]MCY0975039.1 hypothetical protein [Paenarthrobacter ureafaciens]QOT18677.1 hypothetical protein HMI59_20130 [Paenarthrobacter sp. YJN-5]UOD81496.1 hypothetical protein MQZ73_00940 [Paenarthrobacter ureafaciens]WNZ04150.1 hypothetical protein PVT25_00925 [Paenarthrobacter ureafaciens]
MRINNVVKFTGVALAGLLALTACGSNESTTAAGSESSPSSSASASSSASPSSSSSASESGNAGTSSGAYKAASWALPITDAGQKLGSIKGESFNVDIFQVATDVASKDSMFVDKETKENLLKKGDPVVYLNYVVTNTSSAEIPLSHSLVSPSAKYTDWKYLGGMPSDSSSDQFEKHGLTSRGTKLKEEAPFKLGPGESFNIAENFAYTAGKEAEVKATLTPQGADGKLDHDKKEQAETTITLK